MIEVAIMIEGQNGLNWQRWQQISRLIEDTGFAGLYRSDHFTNETQPDLDSLETWVSLSWLASHTSRIDFGPLVTPVSFRDPVFTARMALAVDDLSGSRLRLGLGAGWQEREHRIYGYNLLSMNERFARFKEGLDIISLLFHSSHPVNYSGKYFSLNEAQLLPRPRRVGGPPIIIGGNGVRYTLPLVAEYANEWNCKFLTPNQFAKNNAILDGLLKQRNRDSKSVKRSMMTNLIFGLNQSEVEKKLDGYSIEEQRNKGFIVGTSEEVAEQLLGLHEAGVQRVVLQWFDLDNLKELENFGKSIESRLR